MGMPAAVLYLTDDGSTPRKQFETRVLDRFFAR
jgi:hypothetical protein